MPALLTRMCSFSHFSTHGVDDFLHAFAVGHVAGEDVSAVPPAARIASAVSVSLSTLRATQATLRPGAASASAIARPMPREAPVTIADLAAQIDLQWLAWVHLSWNLLDPSRSCWRAARSDASAGAQFEHALAGDFAVDPLQQSAQHAARARPRKTGRSPAPADIASSLPSAPATRPACISNWRISSGSSCGWASTFEITGIVGRAHRRVGQRRRPAARRPGP